MDKFTETYLNIISETFYRYQFDEVLAVTIEVTDEGRSPWVRGETGSKILQKLKEYGGAESYGRQYLGGSGEAYKDEEQYRRLHQLAKYIVNYWQMRAKSGSSFDVDLAHNIYKAANIDGNGTNVLVVSQVGQISYGIWKALNVKANKAEAMDQHLKDIGVDFSQYKYGDTVDNIELKIIGVSSKNSSYGYRYSSSSTCILKCEDPKTGIKYNVRLGNGRNSNRELDTLWNIFNNLDGFSRNNPTIKDKFYEKYPQFKNYLIHVSGKILNVSEEYKIITLNYVTLKDSLNANELDNILYDIN